MKLYGKSNYDIWKAQMLCLLESQALLHIISEEYSFPGDQYDKLVTGWIIGSMDDKLLRCFDYSKSAGSLWNALNTVYNLSRRDREGT